MLRITVADDAPGLPRHRSPGDVREVDDGTPGGWGLGILSHLADDWAVEHLIPGKEVWAELSIPAELTLDMASCHRPVRFDAPSGSFLNPADLGDIGRQRASDDRASSPGTDAGDEEPLTT